MRRPGWLVVLLLSAVWLPAGEPSFRVDPAEGELTVWTTLQIAFDRPMAAPVQMDDPRVEPPVELDPPVPAEFVWQTPTRGVLRILSGLLPAQDYRVRLRSPAPATKGAGEAWSGIFRSPPLRVTTEWEVRSALGRQPQVPLDFNYPMDTSSAARGIVFQNRATRERVPAEVLLNLPEGETASEVEEVPAGDRPSPPTSFRVRPRTALPAGAVWDLVVEQAVDALGGRGLSYPRVFPLGETRAPHVVWLGAFGQAGRPPVVRAKLSQPLQFPLPPGALQIDPPVEDWRVRPGDWSDEILGEGRLLPGVRYRVTVAADVAALTGFTLGEPSVWGVTGPASSPQILLPGSELRQRSRHGLRMALVAEGLSSVRWHLAPVPVEDVRGLRALLQNRGNRTLSEDPSALFGLQPGASGEVAVARGQALPVEWNPPEGVPPGTWLFQAEGTAEDGRRVVNAVLVNFSDLVVTQKLTPDLSLVRIASMATGRPVPGARVRLLDGAGMEIARTSASDLGEAVFPVEQARLGASYEVQAGASGALVPVEKSAYGEGGFEGGYAARFGPAPAWRGLVFTDRPVVRPGARMAFKAMVRAVEGSALVVPRGAGFSWQIIQGSTETEVLVEPADISPSGGAAGEWMVPAEAGPGEYRLTLLKDGQPILPPAAFRVEVARQPPFSLVCEAAPDGRGLLVRSAYFHGAANAGARVRWQARWFSDAEARAWAGESPEVWDYVWSDDYSEGLRERVWDAESSGEGVLDADGRLQIDAVPPFPDAGRRAGVLVNWTVEVTGPEGRPVTAGFGQKLAMVPAVQGLRVEVHGSRLRIATAVRALGETPAPLPPAAAVDIYRVETRSVKQRVSPDVYRYLNRDVFERVAGADPAITSPAEVTVPGPGRYVVVTRPEANSGLLRTSSEVWVSGPEDSMVPVRGDQLLELRPEHGTERQPWRTGTTASVVVTAPAAGLAWVTVETDRVLESFTLPLEGNVARIPVPVRADFAPNAVVCVYALRPGGPDRLPAEMFGLHPVVVEDPARVLQVQVEVPPGPLRPGTELAGMVTVRSGDGTPAAGAEVSLAVVDEAALKLGVWSLPEPRPAFFPTRSHAVRTFPALRGLEDGVGAAALTEKGFIIGDGGEETPGSVEFVRKDFPPLILWKPLEKADAAGRVAWSCPLPGALTTFRVVAVAQTAAAASGAGEATVRTAKELMLEPLLPAFVREGDEVELRVLARQTAVEEMTVVVRCQAGGLQLAADEPRTAVLRRGVPELVAFPVRVPAAGGEAEVTLSAEGGGFTDAVQVLLPRWSRELTVRREAAGRSEGPDLYPVAWRPESWAVPDAQMDLTVSSTPGGGLRLGVPAVLHYPHGCLEQRSAQMLVLAGLGSLLESVPLDEAERTRHRRMLEDSLAVFASSVLPDGNLPMWPGGSAPSAVATIQTAWAVAAAAAAGVEVSGDWLSMLQQALTRAGDSLGPNRLPPDLRAFALFAASQGAAGEPGVDVRDLEALHRDRDALGVDGLAWLALAGQASGLLAPERLQDLLDLARVRSATTGASPEARSLGSSARSEALRLLAVLRCGGQPDSAQQEALQAYPARVGGFSTQENLWWLQVLAATRSPGGPPLRPGGDTPKAAARSADRTALRWDGLPAAGPWSGRMQGKGPIYWNLTARLPVPFPAAPAAEGLALERVVRNLTEAGRDGSAEHPFRPGDRVLVRLHWSGGPFSFLAIEDELPACLEVVNAALEPGAFADDGLSAASHTELRGRRVSLFIDDAPGGSGMAGYVARVGSPGIFAWPGAQAGPMYVPSLQGRTGGTTCHVASE